MQNPGNTVLGPTPTRFGNDLQGWRMHTPLRTVPTRWRAVENVIGHFVLSQKQPRGPQLSPALCTLCIL